MQRCRRPIILTAGLGQCIHELGIDIAAVGDKIVLYHLCGQLIRHGQFQAEYIATHIANRTDYAVLAVRLCTTARFDAARWFQLRICITARMALSRTVRGRS